MKRYCKNVDITDSSLVRTAVFDCLKRKWGRYDVVRLFCEADPLKRSRSVMSALLTAKDKSPVFCVIDKITDMLVTELKEKTVTFPQPRTSVRYDACCCKWREISIQDIKQQFYDYIAVAGLQDVLRRIGEYQCASIPGRGQKYGITAVRRWMRNHSITYAWKGDVKQCFPSIKRENIMAFLRRYVANEPLIGLIDTLLASHEKGLSIGSYLSQWLCNLYLSTVYHHVSEKCMTMRRGVLIKMARHVLFYMDDIFLCGSSKKLLGMAGRIVKRKLQEIGLELKANWRLWRLNDKSFVDIMGVRIYRKHITIRARVFIRLRRTLKTAKEIIGTCRRLPEKLARRIASYYGILKHTDSHTIARRCKLWPSLAVAKAVIRNA